MHYDITGAKREAADYADYADGSLKGRL